MQGKEKRGGLGLILAVSNLAMMLGVALFAAVFGWYLFFVACFPGCSTELYVGPVRAACIEAIEAHAWPRGSATAVQDEPGGRWPSPRFSAVHSADGTVTLEGHALELPAEDGSWRHHSYACSYGLVSGRVEEVSVWVGR